MLAVGRSFGSREEFWRYHVEGWENSGLSQVDYCARAGVSRTSFAKWRQRVRRTELPSLVEVGCLSATSEAGLCLVLGDGHYRLEIGASFSADALDAVLTVLEARL